MSANNVIIQDLQEYKYTTKKLSYILKSKQKNIDFKKLKKMGFFNRKKVMSESMYYTNGTFYTKNVKVDFERAYFLEGSFYMQNCFTKDGNDTVKSKSAKYDKSFIEYSGVKLKKNNKIYHKFKYRLKVD